MKSPSTDYIIIPVVVVAIAVSAQLFIKLPDDFSVAPITGQSLAILMIAELMDWRKGSIAVLLYLILGGLGLPFFADYESGWSSLSGPSAGYFIGFLLTVSVIGSIANKGSKELLPTFGRMLIATLLILLCGWLGLLRFLSAEDAFMKGVIPFLPGALVKIILALILIGLIRRFNGLMGQFSKE